MSDDHENPDIIRSVIYELTKLDENDLFKNARILGEKPSREDCLRQVLRPHDDAGFVSADDRVTELRKDLDKALEELTFREIRRQLNLQNAPLSAEVLEGLLDLFGSGAFLRYVNAYLYFGVRFLPCAEEFVQYKKGQSSDASKESTSSSRPRKCPDENELQFSLNPPPALTNPSDGAARYNKFRDLRELDDKTPEIKVALQFLDDYHVTPEKPEFYELEEPMAFELWLRGLRPEIDDSAMNDPRKPRFDQIRSGLSRWARERGDFYLGLNPGEPNRKIQVSTDGAQIQGNQHRPQEQQVRSAIAGRLALNDLYWIARLLRANVGSNGWVQYHKNNWLRLLRFNTILRHESSKARPSSELQKAATPIESQESVPEAESRAAPLELDLKEEAAALLKTEEILRSVFDLVLDLVQNALEVTDCGGGEDDMPGSTLKWRQAFDEELDEIENQRKIRHFRDPSLPPGFDDQPTPGVEPGVSANVDTPRSTAPDPTDTRIDDYWSKRIFAGERPQDLIGLCFSGGGIRSATLNLGVLQGLQELDMLRHLDYISTVSGGGFIGSWLVGNVRRSQYWLGRRTDWKESIRHLRDYSNYLAPRTGVLSADTWNLANSWFRNTFLIQITGIAWLFALLLAAILGMRCFLYAASVSLGGFSVAACITYLTALITVMATSYYLVNLSLYVTGKPSFFVRGILRVAEHLGKSAKEFRVWIESFADTNGAVGNWLRKRLKSAASVQDRLVGGGWVLRIGVLPSWFGGWALASCLWFHAPLHDLGWISLYGVTPYSEILEAAWRPWLRILIPSAAGFAILSWNTLRWHKVRTTFLFVVPVCTLVLYLELVAIFYFFRIWSAVGDSANSLAYVFGPALVLAAFTVCILLLIGLTGRNTNEAQREWWTRFGTWLGIFTGVGVFISGVAVFGPWIVIGFFSNHGEKGWLHNIKWTALAGWIGTVISGLLAGNSSKTAGQADDSSSETLEILAKAGGLLFIVGSFLLGSTLLYILLFEIFGPDYGVIRSNALHMLCELEFSLLWKTLILVLAIGWIFSHYFEINIFGFSQFYRNRIVRCYLGATRWTHGNRRPNEFTKFDFRDDMGLWRFRTDSPGEDISREGDSGGSEAGQQENRDCTPYRGPFPIINCSLNLGGSSDLALNTRRGASFTLTSLRCGSDQPRVGYAPTIDKQLVGTTMRCKGGFADGLQLGQAVAISGAAVSANMGYNTSPLVAFLLTMFNVRLGWWFPNPGQRKWNSHGLTFGLKPLCQELFGVADDKSDYINVSDGGHFENLAIYELIRRRCKLIIACDAEADEQMQFGGLGKMIRLCQTDFGAVIELDVKSIRPQEHGYSRSHCAVGIIKYCTGEIGHLIYLKASMTGDEDVSIAQYRSTHPSFPHESTANQFYSEDQFESYRMLGLHMVHSSFQGTVPGDDPLMTAERLFDLLAPAGPPSEKFLEHSKALMDMWEKFRGTAELLDFMHELITLAIHPTAAAKQVSDHELCIGLELIQLMENVFLDLRLDDFWEHPDNRGWAILFMRWARSPKFRKIWLDTRRTFGIRFEYFCCARLGLKRDDPIVRV